MDHMYNAIKDYNGYLLPDLSLMELNKFILQFQKKCYLKVRELTERNIAHLIARKLDGLAVFGRNEFMRIENIKETRGLDVRVLYHCYRVMGTMYKDVSSNMNRSPMVDFDTEIHLFPKNGMILVLFFSKQKEIIDLWESQDSVTDYNYWKINEANKSLNHREALERRMVWTDIIDQGGAKDGMRIIVTWGLPHVLHLSRDSIISNIPSFVERTKLAARAKAINQKRLEIEEEYAWKEYVEVGQWLKSEQGGVHINKLIEEVQQIILAEIEEKHLLETFDSTWRFLNSKR